MRVDLTMLETGVSSVGPAILEAQRGITRERLGCAHWWKAPHNVYPARDDDRWLVIVVSSDSGMGSAEKSNGPAPVGRGMPNSTPLWHVGKTVMNWTS